MVCEGRPRGFPHPAALVLGRPAGIAPHLVPLVDAINELGTGGVPGEADGGGVGGLGLHVPWGHRGDCGDQGTACSGSNLVRSPPLLGATPQEPRIPPAGRIPPQHIPASLGPPNPSSSCHLSPRPPMAQPVTVGCPCPSLPVPTYLPAVSTPSPSCCTPPSPHCCTPPPRSRSWSR